MIYFNVTTTDFHNGGHPCRVRTSRKFTVAQLAHFTTGMMADGFVFADEDSKEFYSMTFMKSYDGWSKTVHMVHTKARA